MESATYLLDVDGFGFAGASERDSTIGTSGALEPELLELPLFNTLLALLMNLEKPCGLSS